MSKSEGYHEYIGGYHEDIGGYQEYIGGCSVHRGKFSTLGLHWGDLWVKTEDLVFHGTACAIFERLLPIK